MTDTQSIPQDDTQQRSRTQTHYSRGYRDAMRDAAVRLRIALQEESDLRDVCLDLFTLAAQEPTP